MIENMEPADVCREWRRTADGWLSGDETCGKRHTVIKETYLLARKLKEGIQRKERRIWEKPFKSVKN